jgi:hypothetical protein
MSNYEEKVLNNVSETTVDDSNVVITDDDANRKLPLKDKFVKFFKDIWFDFLASFKYNNMKLAGILVCVPGVLLGFFILFHYNIISILVFPFHIEMVNGMPQTVSDVKDLSALFYFALTLCGTLNLFTGVTLMGKKNLGSVIGATVTTSLMVIFAVCYLYYIFTSVSYLQGFFAKNGYYPTTNPINVMSLDFIMVMVSVGLSVVTSTIGVLLGFKNYDRSYNKRDAR